MSDPDQKAEPAMADDTTSPTPQFARWTDDQAARLYDLLGLPLDGSVTADDILAVIESLVAQETTPDQQTSGTAAATAAAARLGLEVIDRDSLAALRTEADEARTVKAQAAQAKIEGTVQAAVAKGKIPPARAHHWIELIAADPTMADTLAAIPNETAVPMNEIGHGDGRELAEPAVWFYPTPATTTPTDGQFRT
ncbi:phage protease [Gordonia sp. CPCC 206044]|uniref:phage protease n=1 Tax=Gordonia sp. CPCC 206044 TaxID=3140793 RepID=UPI003AF3ED67